MNVEANHRGIHVALTEAKAERERAERTLAVANAEQARCLALCGEAERALADANAQQDACHDRASDGVAALRFARDSAREIVRLRIEEHSRTLALLGAATSEQGRATNELAQRRASERAIEIALERRAAKDALERQRKAADD